MEKILCDDRILLRIRCCNKFRSRPRTHTRHEPWWSKRARARPGAAGAASSSGGAAGAQSSRVPFRQPAPASPPKLTTSQTNKVEPVQQQRSQVLYFQSKFSFLLHSGVGGTVACHSSSTHTRPNNPSVIRANEALTRAGRRSNLAPLHYLQKRQR